MFLIFAGTGSIAHGDPPEKVRPKVLEISVQGDRRQTGKVVWKKKSGSVSGTSLTTPFLFEWTRIPDDAECFQIVWDVQQSKVSNRKWIPIEEVSSSGKPSDIVHLYVSARPEKKGKKPPTIDSEYKRGSNNGVKPLGATTAEEGWVFIGHWVDGEPGYWRSISWLDRDYYKKTRKRRKIKHSPSELESEGVSILADFPMNLRRAPSTDAETVDKEGRLIRPDMAFSISEVTLLPGVKYDSVWAKVRKIGDD